MTSAVRKRRESTMKLGALDTLVGYLLRRAEVRMMADLSESLLPLDLRPSTFSILVVVAERPGIIQSDVCDVLATKHANFVPLVSELERLGYLQRRPSAVDRRQVELRLSTDGARALRRAWKVVEAQEARMATALGTTGQRQILSLLRTLVADFESESAAPE